MHTLSRGSKARAWKFEPLCPPAESDCPHTASSQVDDDHGTAGQSASCITPPARRPSASARVDKRGLSPRRVASELAHHANAGREMPGTNVLPPPHSPQARTGGGRHMIRKIFFAPRTFQGAVLCVGRRTTVVPTARRGSVLPGAESALGAEGPLARECSSRT